MGGWLASVVEGAESESPAGSSGPQDLTSSRGTPVSQLDVYQGGLHVLDQDFMEDPKYQK